MTKHKNETTRDFRFPIIEERFPEKSTQRLKLPLSNILFQSIYRSIIKTERIKNYSSVSLSFKFMNKLKFQLSTNEEDSKSTTLLLLETKCTSNM